MPASNLPPKGPQTWQIVVAISVVNAVVVGCAFILFSLRPGSEVLGSLGDRSVHGIAARGNIVAQFQSGDGKTATVKLGDDTALVTADRVELASGRMITIPAACKAVELREVRNGMRVFFDGVEA